MSQDTDTEYCLWKTSKSEIDIMAEQMRQEGIKVPENLDYEEIVRQYKKSLEWGIDSWSDWLKDAIEESIPATSS